MRLATFILGACFLAACKAPAPATPEGVVPSPVTSAPVAPTPPITAPAVQPPATPTLPAGKIEDIDFGSYTEELAGHIGLELGESRLDAIDKIRLYFAPEPGTSIINLTSSTFERDDGSVMLFAWNDMPDDSVFAEEIYAVFSGPGGANKFNQSLAAFGLRMKCRRGENAMQWTTEICP